MSIEQAIQKQLSEARAARAVVETPPVVEAPAAEVVVEAPAVEVPVAETVAEEKAGLAFKAIGKGLQGLVIGVGAAAGSPNKLDKDGEFVSQSDLVGMAHDFTAAQNRTFKANHKDVIDAKLVRSWPGAPIIDDNGQLRTLKADEVLTDDMNVVGIDIREGNESHWFVGSQLPQSLADKAAQVVGFSFGAAVTKKEVA